MVLIFSPGHMNMTVMCSIFCIPVHDFHINIHALCHVSLSVPSLLFPLFCYQSLHLLSIPRFVPLKCQPSSDALSVDRFEILKYKSTSNPSELSVEQVLEWMHTADAPIARAVTATMEKEKATGGRA